MAGGQTPNLEALTIETQIKLRLMGIIDADLRDRFRTVEQMAKYAKVDDAVVYRLRARRYDKFSLSYLLKFAEIADVTIKIDIR